MPPEDARPPAPAALPVNVVHELGGGGLPGSAGRAVALAFAPDSRLLALGGERSVIELWDAREGRALGELSGHHRSLRGVVVGALVFSPDGALLASGGFDKTVRLWRPDTGETVNVLTGFSSPVRKLAFSPTSPLLAAADDRNAVLFDLGTAAVAARPLPQVDGGISSLAFSPDGKLLALGSDDRNGAVHLIDPTAGVVVRSLAARVRSLAFSPDGRLLAAGLHHDKQVQLWDAQSWEPTAGLRVPSYSAFGLAFNARGVLGAACGDRVCLWDPAAADEPVSVKVPYVKNCSVGTLAFSPDARLMATCRTGAMVRIYD